MKIKNKPFTSELEGQTKFSGSQRRREVQLREVGRQQRLQRCSMAGGCVALRGPGIFPSPAADPSMDDIQLHFPQPDACAACRAGG